MRDEDRDRVLKTVFDLGPPRMNTYWSKDVIAEKRIDLSVKRGDTVYFDLPLSREDGSQFGVLRLMKRVHERLEIVRLIATQPKPGEYELILGLE